MGVVVVMVVVLIHGFSRVSDTTASQPTNEPSSYTSRPAGARGEGEGGGTGVDDRVSVDGY